jgi:hypothetical protein
MSRVLTRLLGVIRVLSPKGGRLQALSRDEFPTPFGYLSAIISVFLFAAEAPRGLAGSVTAEEAMIATQGTVPDGDLGLLAGFVGLEASDTLNYEFTTKSGLSAWSATLSGVYAGTSLNVGYSGNLFIVPGGITTSWDSNGFYGAAPWSGSGNASFSDTATGFRVNLQSSLHVGGNSGLVNVGIDALNDGISLTYINSSGTVLINGISTSSEIYSLKWLFGFLPIGNDFDFGTVPLPLFGPVRIKGDTLLGFIPIGGGDDMGSGTAQVTTTIVPEPSALTLFGIGTLGVLGYAWRRRNRAAA